MHARKIRNAFKCCVRIVCHTGKANAREKTLDQYTSRGGSALPDGSRMVAVMQAWSPETRIKLPQGCKADSDSSITVLARPKLSYAKGNLPSIFIRRTGWAFEHFTEVFFSEEETQQGCQGSGATVPEKPRGRRRPAFKKQPGNQCHKNVFDQRGVKGCHIPTDSRRQAH